MGPTITKEIEEHIKKGYITLNMIETAWWDGYYSVQSKEKLNRNRFFTENLINGTDFDDAKIAFLVNVEASWVASIRKELGK